MRSLQLAGALAAERLVLFIGEEQVLFIGEEQGTLHTVLAPQSQSPTALPDYDKQVTCSVYQSVATYGFALNTTLCLIHIVDVHFYKYMYIPSCERHLQRVSGSTGGCRVPGSPMQHVHL